MISIKRQMTEWTDQTRRALNNAIENNRRVDKDILAKVLLEDLTAISDNDLEIMINNPSHLAETLRRMDEKIEDEIGKELRLI